MSQHRTHYTPEFQLEAARLVVEQGYSHQQAGERLGVCSGTIKNWVKKFRQSGTLPPASQPVPEALELKNLFGYQTRASFAPDGHAASLPLRTNVSHCLVADA